LAASSSATDVTGGPYERPRYELPKRIVDLFTATSILILLSPAWLLIAAAIRATSSGPALFRRRVVGRAGKRFIYFKFRTMREGDDSHHREWLKDFVTRDSAYVGGEFKVRDDPRVTRLGRFLRRTSLDEVPQLINVLKGDMSVVGPRPRLPYEFRLDAPGIARRLSVKPGLAGLWQVSGRAKLNYDEALRLDLQYIDTWSFWVDLKLIAKTFWVVVTLKGAY